MFDKAFFEFLQKHPDKQFSFCYLSDYEDYAILIYDKNTHKEISFMVDYFILDQQRILLSEYFTSLMEKKIEQLDKG